MFSKYRKNCDNKPWAYICLKGFFAGLIFVGAYFRRDLLLEGILCFKIMVGLDNKNSSKDNKNSLKQVKTANPNSPWAFIWEGLLSEGSLHLSFGGLIFGRAYYYYYFFFFFLGGGGGAYYRNFTVYNYTHSDFCIA